MITSVYSINWAHVDSNGNRRGDRQYGPLRFQETTDYVAGWLHRLCYA